MSTEQRDSNPNAGGPEGLAGDMGVSSERVGPTGPGQVSTDGTRDVSEDTDPDDPRRPSSRPAARRTTPTVSRPRRATPAWTRARTSPGQRRSRAAAFARRR